MAEPFVRSVVLKRDEVADFEAYPFSIPAIAALTELRLDAPVTFQTGGDSCITCSLTTDPHQTPGRFSCGIP